MTTNNGYEIGWDDQIEKDGPEFVLLPEGDYDFTVIDFERGRHGGSDKLPPCHKAIVHIKVEGKGELQLLDISCFCIRYGRNVVCLLRQWPT